MNLPSRLTAAAGRVPCASLLVAGAAIAVHLVPGAAAAWQYERTALGDGELWRVLTCHLTHVSGEHLFWDLLPFLLLGAILEMRGRTRLLLCLGVAAVAVPVGVHILLPGLDTYRGLSGLATAMLALLAASVLGEQIATRRPARILAAAVLPAILAFKIGYELATGGSLVIDVNSSRLLPVPLAHVIGAVTGLIFGIERRVCTIGTLRRCGSPVSLAVVAILLLTSACSMSVNQGGKETGDPRHEFPVAELDEEVGPFPGVYTGTVEREAGTYHRFLFPGVLAGDAERKLEVLVAMQARPEGKPDVRAAETNEELPTAPPATLLLSLGTVFDYRLSDFEMLGDGSRLDVGRSLAGIYPDYRDEDHVEAHVVYLNVHRDELSGWHRGPRNVSQPGEWRNLWGPDRAELEWVGRDRAAYTANSLWYLLTVPLDIALSPLWLIYLTFFFDG